MQTHLVFTVFAIPAIAALLAKVGMFFYARYSKVHNLQTKLYLMFLFSLAIQNLVEIRNFTNVEGLLHVNYSGRLWYGALILAVALILHLALITGTNWRGKRENIPVSGILLVYAPALVLEALLWFTTLLIVEFEPMSYTVTQIPGPLYFLFQIYSLLCLSATAGALVYGCRRQTITLKRQQSKFLLVGILPFVVLSITILALRFFGFRGFNATGTVPLTITFFLGITVYAIHQHRLLDIEFFLPWSKIRKRKTAFYKRIQSTIAEMAKLQSVREVLQLLANAFSSQVALIGGARPLLAVVQGQENEGNSGKVSISFFPREALQKIDSIVVADEIADRSPELYSLMKQYKVGAIVPFYPHSATAAHWMLIGERFSDNVYSPLDFKIIEELFARLANRFLDDLLIIRSQLAEATSELHLYERRLAMAWDELTALRRSTTTLEAEARHLREENALLRRRQLRAVASGLPEPISSGQRSFHEYIEETEERILREAMVLSRGDFSKAARILGIRDIQTIYYLVGRYSIDAGEYR